MDACCQTGLAEARPIFPFSIQSEARPQTLSVAALERCVAERTASLQAAWQREHDLAEALTQSLLMPPASLRWPGLSVNAFYEAASPEGLVGGDFYDFFPVSEDRLALVLGDVCGKGLAAAVQVPAVKFALRGFLSEHACPGRAMACLNDLLCRNSAIGGASCPVALALAVLDQRSGEVSCAVAGAERPLIVRAEGGCHPLAPEGLLLGVQRGIEYDTATSRLNLRDVLLMVTDGLSEARRGGQMFGSEGVTDVASRTLRAASHWSLCDSESAWEVGHGVLTAARAFGGGRFADDACVLTARLHRD